MDFVIYTDRQFFWTLWFGQLDIGLLFDSPVIQSSKVKAKEIDIICLMLR